MISPFSFFIFVMSTFFSADLIPEMFFTPLKSSSILLDVLLSFHFVCFSYIFYALAHFFQSLFLFFGFASPLLNESSDLNVFFLKSSQSLLLLLSRLLLHLFFLRSCRC